MENTKRIIEVNGVKLEVDLSNAKVISNYRVGDKVKVLTKSYGTNYNVYPGMIIDFTNFKSLPTITVAYLVVGYKEAKIEWTNFNQETKDVEIAPCENNWIPFTRESVIECMDREIFGAEQAVIDLKLKKDFFLNNFNKFFSDFFVTEDRTID